MPKLCLSTCIIYELWVDVDELPTTDEGFADLIGKHEAELMATQPEWAATSITDEDDEELYDCG